MMNPMQMMPNGNPMQMMGQLQQFMQNFKGDPRAQIQQMMNSGQVSQQQYDQAVQMANNIAQMMGIKR